MSRVAHIVAGALLLVPDGRAPDFPGEGTVDYNYGGDQKRRQRTVGGVSTWYNWGLGWGVLNEESGTGSGTLQKTYVGGMAEIAGSTPATGAYSYYATDNLGSPRAVYNQAKALVAELDYTPYGQAYTANDTIGITHRYTGHDWDATAALYFAPYRFYNPQIARWMSRDPLGMVDGPNVYAYVRANPMWLVDRLGASGWPPMPFPAPGDTDITPTDCALGYTACMSAAYAKYFTGMWIVSANRTASRVLCAILHGTGTADFRLYMDTANEVYDQVEADLTQALSADMADCEKLRDDCEDGCGVPPIE